MYVEALQEKLVVDDWQVSQIIERFNTPVPRYTSYPTALEWQAVEDHLLLDQIGQTEKSAVYAHIPFCENRCLFCGCHVIISKRKEFAERYLKVLLQEIDDKTSLRSSKENKIITDQIHLGGGTPNYLSIEQMARLIDHFRQRFDVKADAEISIELDPVVSDPSYLEGLKKIGFNRISYGIQDVNPRVLEAVDRPQDIRHLESMVNAAKGLGFASVNVDFIYGLPFQTLDNFANNLDFIKKLRPNRIALFSYAHVPWLKKHQLTMSLENLPSAEEKLKIYLLARHFFLEQGYIQIGMDHYALPDDSLSLAFSEKKLYRNFMGYTTTAAENLLAFGVSGISYLNGVFAQNKTRLKGHELSVQEKKNYFEKGFVCSQDDLIRSAVIQRLMGNLRLQFAEIEASFKINFQNYFAEELQRLQVFANDNLLTINSQGIEVSSQGLFALRHISSTFDAYRQKTSEKSSSTGGFSKGI